MFELKAQMYFAAAHHLLNYEGECENQHGHNWLVEAYVKGTELDKSNILVDYKVLKRELRKDAIAKLAARTEESSAEESLV